MIFVYKTVNRINSKYYIGVHEGSETDEYLGSGTYLKAAIKKYGIENFTREILQICETKNEAYNIERSLVTPELIDSGVCYNLNVDGYGGWYHIDSSGDNNQMKKRKVSAKVWKSRKDNPLAVLKQTETAKENIKKAHKANIGSVRSEETRKKISLSNKGQTRSIESKQRMSDSAKKKPKASEETKKKRSENAKKQNRDMSLLAKGIKRSEEFKKIISDRMKQQHANQLEKYTCMYCGLESKLKANITRWHNENCRHKESNKVSSSSIS